MRTHRYATHLSWSGSTGAGYRGYAREHRGGSVVDGVPAAAVDLSADPVFGGDASTLNPEQLLVLAASSCQLLSFLAVAARRGVDDLAYPDDADAEMPEDERPVRLASIRLAPTITVAAGTDPDLVAGLVQQAHDECYVASSLRTPVTVDPRVVVRDAVDDVAPDVVTEGAP